jgi:hypothetical protein
MDALPDEPPTMCIGYARISTGELKFDLQLDAFNWMR